MRTALYAVLLDYSHIGIHMSGTIVSSYVVHECHIQSSGNVEHNQMQTIAYFPYQFELWSRLCATATITTRVHNYVWRRIIVDYSVLARCKPVWTNGGTQQDLRKLGLVNSYDRKSNVDS